MGKNSLLIFFLLLILTACDNERNTEINYTPLIQTTEEVAFFQDVVNETYKLLVKADRETALSGGGQTFIERVLVSSEILSSDTTLLTFDFTKYYNDWDNVHKDSLFTARMVGDFGTTDGEAYVDLNGFVIQDKTLQGTLVFRNTGSSEKYTNYEARSEYLSFSDTLNRMHRYNTEQTFLLRKAFSIPGEYSNLWFKTAGTANGQSSSGNKYQYTISDTLIDSLRCMWISRGSIGLEFIQRSDSTFIDFIGNDADSCNSSYTINVDGRYPLDKNL